MSWRSIDNQLVSIRLTAPLKSPLPQSNHTPLLLKEIELDLTINRNLTLWVELPLTGYSGVPTFDIIPFLMLFIGLFIGQHVKSHLLRKKYLPCAQFMDYIETELNVVAVSKIYKVQQVMGMTTIEVVKTIVERWVEDWEEDDDWKTSY